MEVAVGMSVHQMRDPSSQSFGRVRYTCGAGRVGRLLLSSLFFMPGYPLLQPVQLTNGLDGFASMQAFSFPRRTAWPAVLKSVRRRALLG